MVSGPSQELLLKQQKLLAIADEDVARVLLEAGPHKVSRTTEKPQKALGQEPQYHGEKNVEGRLGKYEQRVPEQ